ncbi:PUA-like domain-containing protein [Mycena amicta]|nr:PUA-like domain-containing protein [Mycena amicta]
MRPEPKVHDEIKQIPVGTLFADRADVYKSAVHGTVEAGIFGTKDLGGAFSIVINGTYPDDKDMGETIIFTGEGRGKKAPLVPGQEAKSKAKSSQVGDQDPNSRGNKALRENIRTGNPVRVIRGPEGNPVYSPARGYRYDGLYDVVSFEMKEGKEGFKMCMFTVERCTSFKQDPLPTHVTGDRPDSLFWSPDRSSAGETLNRRIPVRTLSDTMRTMTVTAEEHNRSITGKQRLANLKFSKRSSF